MTTRLAVFLTAFCLLFPLAAGRSGFAQTKPDTAAVSKTEEVEPVEEVTPVEIETGNKPGRLELIGHLHPMLVHFPIAWLLLLLLTDTATLLLPGLGLARAGFYLLVLTVLSFIPTGITGFILARSEGSDPQVLALVTDHRNINIAAALVCLAALILRARIGDCLERRSKWLYYSLILAATVLIVISSHLGGEMVYGEAYFPF